MLFVLGLWTLLRALRFGSVAIALENLALRHQLEGLRRSVPRPRLSRSDRILWVWLSRRWTDWRSSLVIVQPATVLAWHRQGFRLYWRWKSRPNPVGRPRLDAELRALIRRMARDNPTWGRRRIQAELALLGYEVAELTVAKYMHRTATHPSPTWRVFLASQARDIVAVDFFLVPTLTYRLLFAFVVLRHHRRELLHLHVSDRPTAVWTARQILEAFPNETAPRYLLRDRDAIYGELFTRCLANMGIRDVIIAPGAPWQNAFRRTGHRLHPPRVPRSRHHSERGPSLPRPTRLSRLLQHRTTSPIARQQQSPATNGRTPARGRVIAMPQVGGLHRRYERAA